MSSQQSVTSADLAAFEQRILSSFRAVVDEVVDKSLHAIDERVAKLESIVTQLQSSTSSSSASTVAAAATAPAAPNTVQVQVRTIAGDLPPVEISAVATVSDLKRMIVHEESASKRRHLLLPASDSAPAGIELIDEKKTLQECGVQSGVVLSLVVDDFQTINQTDKRQLKDFIKRDQLTLWGALINQRSGALELDVNAASAEASVATIAEPLKNNHTLSELKLVQTDGVNVQGLNTILHILPSSTSITRLDLSRMSLSLQSCTLLGNVLRSNTSITSLDLGDNNLDENRISALIDGLEHNTHLTKLNLQGCISGRENLTLICDFLVETSIITEISLSRCGVTSDTASEIARVLQFNSSVTNLNLFNNKLKTAGAKTICEALALNTSLTFLDVGLCDLSSESNEEETTGIFHFAEVIEQNQTLKALHLYRNSMRHADAAALASALEKSTSLGELIFPLNDNVLDLAAVSGCLMVNSSLTKIRFFDNFTQEGFVSLATALQMNQTVTDLDFVGCNIPQDGAIAFAETLRTSKSLKLLGFNDVVVTNPGLTAIFEALQVNSSLTRLWAKSIRCNISQSKNCCNALVGIFAKNTSIQYMEIGANQFGGALRAVQVAEALQQNSTLTDLQFSNLSIADDGAIAFAKLLSEKSILKNLGLAFNLIGRRGINSLVQALRTNTSLTRFWISSGAFSVFDLDFLFGDENLGHKRCNVEVMTEQARVD